MSGTVRTESLSEDDVGFIARASSDPPDAVESGGRAKGILLALFAVFCVSPDAMLLRSMVAVGAQPLDAAFAKYAGVILFMSCFALVRGVGGLFASKRHLLASVFLQSIVQLCFTFSLLYAEPARALLIISLTPLWAALLGVAFIGDMLPTRTVVAIACAILSVGVVVAPQVVPGLATTAATSVQADSRVGDAFAIVTSFAQASVLTVWRHAAIHAPGSDLVLVSGLAACVTGTLCLHLRCGGEIDLTPHGFLYFCTPQMWQSAAFVLLALCDAGSSVLYFVGQTKAPRYISAGEVALICLLEDILGPIWVFLRFGTAPSAWTIAGGALLLATLVTHEVAGMRAPPDIALGDQEVGRSDSFSLAPTTPPGKPGRRGCWSAPDL